MKELCHTFNIFDDLKAIFKKCIYPGPLGHSFPSLTEEGSTHGMLPAHHEGYQRL